ncbi:MAG: hypothetical protein R3297_09355 [Desulfobulbales bacterium]|nr:hypothetical protein [Desulfobulbales bacterium]
MKKIIGLAVLISAVFMLAGVSFANGMVDADADGVMDDYDLCPESIADVHMCEDGMIFNIESPKPNRYLTTQYCEDPFLWAVVIPKGRANGWFNQIGVPTMAETFGCSCLQIVDIMMYETGEDLDGHIKHGCSKSLIEDFIYKMACRMQCDAGLEAALEECSWAADACHTACCEPLNQCLEGCAGDADCQLACFENLDDEHQLCHEQCFQECEENALQAYRVCLDSCL